MKLLPFLIRLQNNGDDKDLFYYFSMSITSRRISDKGAESAQKGLALETGAAEAKAKFYFQLGLAQAGKGQTADACASFKMQCSDRLQLPQKQKGQT